MFIAFLNELKSLKLKTVAYITNNKILDFMHGIFSIVFKTEKFMHAKLFLPSSRQ